MSTQTFTVFAIFWFDFIEAVRVLDWFHTKHEPLSVQCPEQRDYYYSLLFISYDWSLEPPGTVQLSINPASSSWTEDLHYSHNWLYLLRLQRHLAKESLTYNVRPLVINFKYKIEMNSKSLQRYPNERCNCWRSIWAQFAEIQLSIRTLIVPRLTYSWAFGGSIWAFAAQLEKERVWWLWNLNPPHLMWCFWSF